MANSPTKLSAGEVAALVGGLMDMGMDDGSDVEVRAYKFGENDLSILGDYYALRMINERFCRIARSVFLPMLRIQPRISAFPPEMKTFDDYSDELENFVSLTISRIEELRGQQMIVMPPSFVSILTDSYYGGSIHSKPTSAKRNEFTSTELRVIEIVTEGLNRALEMAWKDLTSVSFTPQSHDENLQFATFVDADDMVVNCSFMVQLPNSDHANFDILYPLQTLKPLAGQLRSRMQSDLVDDDMTWRDRLERAVMEVPLEVTARLATPEVALGDLMAAKSGQTMPVKLRPTPSMLVDGQKLFDVDFGTVGGKTAMKLIREHELS